MEKPGNLFGDVNRSNTRHFLAYFLAASAAVISAAVFLSSAHLQGPLFLLDDGTDHGNQAVAVSSRSPKPHVWPSLEFNWRIAVASIVGFLGSAFGTVGGVGGGGIFVPMLNLVVGFDTKSAAALSKCMIMGASASSVWYNLQVSHPSKEVPILDYDLALLFQPMLMLGITIGVELSVVFPYWLITVLIIILFIGTSSRSFYKGTLMWKQETILLKEQQERKEQEEGAADSTSIVARDPKYEPLLHHPPHKEKSLFETFLFNLRWRNLLVLLLVWCSFLALQIVKNNSETCGTVFWVVNIVQIPVALSVFLWEAVKLCRESRLQRINGCFEGVCEASIEFTPLQLLFCALCGVLGGTVGGLLGSGGGFILGPLLLELGVIPQVASATATFVMMYSSSLSVVEFYFLNRFPVPFAIYLAAISVLAGFWGQCLVRKLVKVLKRASIIVFILSGVIFASALTMGVVGTETSLAMMKNHDYMGFLDFCTN